MTIVFENTDTMRWQVQEMARAERMLRDEQIAHEVETYNELIPDAGELSAHAFIELTVRRAAARVAAEARRHRARTSRFVLPDGSARARRPSDEDEERLTRDDTTAAVHFLKFAFTPRAGRRRSRAGPVRIVVDHPEYRRTTSSSTTSSTPSSLARPACDRRVASAPMQHPRPPPRSRAPAARPRSTPATPGYDLHAAPTCTLEPARRPRARPTGIAIAIPRATRASCSRARGSRCGTASRV